jgi:hypothetical protein
MTSQAKSLVTIGIPSGDFVHADFAMSLAMLCMSPGAQVALANAKSSLVPLGRNQIVGAAQAMKATHLLFLDTDMVFPADTLKRLLEHEKDIVGATYSKRAPPFHSLTITEEGALAQISSGLHRVKLLPTGCLLIRMHVFDKLSLPYFNLETEGEQLRGEDYYFCEKARAGGFDLWCDGDLSSQLGHIGQNIFRLNGG